MMIQNYCNIWYEYFRCAFFCICLIATIIMIVLCVSQYLRNDDLCEIDFVRFNSDKDRIYPSVSICLTNPFIETKLAQHGKGITIARYRDFLYGDLWDPRMLHIDYDNVTIPMFNNVIQYGLQYPNWTWFWYNHDDAPSKAWTQPYISYRNSDDKCFTMDFKYQKNVRIKRFGLRIKSKLFPHSIRPDRYAPPEEGLEVYLHYPQQFVRSYAAGIGKWKWPSRDNQPKDFRKGYYMMDIMVQNLNIVIRRDKPNQDSPCDGDWLHYDHNVWKSAIDKSKCKHPLWKGNGTYPLCNSKAEMKKVMPLDFEDLEKYPISCRRIEKFQIGYYESNMEKAKRNIIKGNWFQLNVHFGDSIYKEITKVQKFDYQSLIGKSHSNKSNVPSSTLF